jgi:hypothetical protein
MCLHTSIATTTTTVIIIVVVVVVVVVVGWVSAVSIGTHYRLDSLGFESQWEVIFSTPFQTVPGAHPDSCTMGNILADKAAGAWR